MVEESALVVSDFKEQEQLGVGCATDETRSKGILDILNQNSVGREHSKVAFHKTSVSSVLGHHNLLSQMKA